VILVLIETLGRFWGLGLANGGRPGFFYGYIIVLVSFFIIVVMWGAIYSFGVFFKPLIQEFEWSTAVTSGAYSTFYFLHGLFYIFAGRLNDRVGPRIVVSICGLFLGLGYFLMSRIQEIWHLYLFYGVILSIGVSGGYVPLISTVARWFSQRRSLMTGLTVAGVGVGTMIMPPIAGWVINKLGWRLCYLLIGVVSLALILLLAQFLRYAPEDMGLRHYGWVGEVREVGLELGGLTLSEAIRTRQFWFFSIIFTSIVFIVQSIMVHIVPHTIEMGVPETMATGIMTLLGLGSITGRIVMGSIGDKMGNRRALIICLVLMISTLSFLTMVEGIIPLYIFALAFGFGYGGHVPLGSPMIADLFGMVAHGSIFGITTFLGTIGGGIGPIVLGTIFDATNSYQLGFITCIGLSILGLTVTLLLGPVD
jgi:MFS family permease